MFVKSEYFRAEAFMIFMKDKEELTPIDRWRAKKNVRRKDHA